MPQMAPMNWALLFGMFFVLMSVTSNGIYFNCFLYNKSKDNMKMNNMTNSFMTWSW